ncbi:MAG: response regulator [Gammaproteobacteria bacterium]|nr:response regulator [Gammaproteobacteria bacterium]
MSEAQEEQARTKILLADDSKVIRTSAAKILGDDYELLLAVDGQDALDQLEQNKDVAAVFTDIGMPYLDGMELLAKIRDHADEVIKGVPVIVVTADETDEAREDALARGATDFITKPFNRVDMLARARSHANAQRERRELEAHTTIDRLTGLGNEQHFLNALKDARSFSQRHGQPLAVLRLQIDDFKSVVQEIGKEKLPRRMREVGSLIKACIRNEDTAARIDNIHFGIITPVCDAEGARKLAARIEKAMKVGADKAKWSKPMTISLAISVPSLFPEADLDDVLEDMKAGATAAAGKGAGSVVLTPKTESLAGERKAGVRLDPTAALRMLANGREEEVKEQLAEIIDQLQPLITLAKKAVPDALKKALSK